MLDYCNTIRFSMPKLILTIGISGSGKTEWAEEYIRHNPNTVDIGRDVFRFDESNMYHPGEAEVSFRQLVAFTNAVRDGSDIIVTDTNLNPVTRYKWYLRVLQHNLELECVVFNTHFVQLFQNPSAIMQLPDYVLYKQSPKFSEFLREAPKTSAKYTFV